MRPEDFDDGGARTIDRVILIVALMVFWWLAVAEWWPL